MHSLTHTKGDRWLAPDNSATKLPPTIAMAGKWDFCDDAYAQDECKPEGDLQSFSGHFMPVLLQVRVLPAHNPDHLHFETPTTNDANT